MEPPSTFENFKRTMVVIANVFPKFQTVKDLVKPLSRKRSFRTSFDSQPVNRRQTLVKSTWEQFYHYCWSFWKEMTWKISHLLNLGILGVFVNTLNEDDKYPFRDCRNLQFPIQMQLSSKRKTFSLYFVPFMESPSKLKHFKKKDNRGS